MSKNKCFSTHASEVLWLIVLLPWLWLKISGDVWGGMLSACTQLSPFTASEIWGERRGCKSGHENHQPQSPWLALLRDAHLVSHSLIHSGHRRRTPSKWKYNQTRLEYSCPHKALLTPGEKACSERRKKGKLWWKLKKEVSLSVSLLQTH